MASLTSLREHCLYLTDSRLTRTQAVVHSTGVDETGAYVVFNRTIFHPKGGGQLNDIGGFACEGRFFKVINLASQGGAVKHYVDPEEGPAIALDKVVDLTVDENTRNLHARVHSAGHLLECAVGTLFPQLEAYKGTHAPNAQASINFKNKEKIPFSDTNKAKVDLERLANELVVQSIALDISWDESGNTRSVGFKGYPSIECGGTHVRHSGEIGVIEVRYVKKEKTDVKIGYDVK